MVGSSASVETSKPNSRTTYELNFNQYFFPDSFLHLTANLQLGPNSYAETNLELSLVRHINNLHEARIEPLVKFLPLILNKLLLLMVKPPTFDGHILNVASAAFNAISKIVFKLTDSIGNVVHNLDQVYKIIL